MSAYIVSTTHINLLVTAALSLDPHEHGMRYFANGTYQTIDNSNATATGRMLLAENVASVTYGYSHLLATSLPGYRPGKDPDTYTFVNYAAELDPVQVLKAIHSFEYQSCEHPGWQASDAKAFCDALTSKAICLLPGYNEAPWEIAS